MERGTADISQGAAHKKMLRYYELHPSEEVRSAPMSSPSDVFLLRLFYECTTRWTVHLVFPVLKLFLSEVLLIVFCCVLFCVCVGSFQRA